MRLICGPDTFDLPNALGDLRVVLYGQSAAKDRGSAGEAAKREVLRRRLEAAPRAWDFLSIALAVVTADFAGLRNQSPDGWTREFQLDVAVADPAFWNSQAASLAEALAFLTTDRWHLQFHNGGILPAPPANPLRPEEDCVVLLSGGLDSLVGIIDLAATEQKTLAISQRVRGDSVKQERFAAHIGDRGLNHLQLNHNVRVPGVREASQRARSMIFIAFGVLAATTLQRYHSGENVPLYVCENGFIAINPPLTGGRLGSLSTRTAHPEFLSRLQGILDMGELRVLIRNPYSEHTKGEMLRGCSDQALLKQEAVHSTSCGRFQRKYRHCGRCVPCQVRRAAFIAWGEPDTTGYVYDPLGQDDAEHASFDDVRSVAMAIASVAEDGLDAWLGGALSSPMIRDRPVLREMVRRGIDELKALHQVYGVK